MTVYNPDAFGKKTSSMRPQEKSSNSLAIRPCIRSIFT